ncbi:MAG TPA: hypothetical protein VI583_05745 [Cyclobacteriaceae bacterium]|nr:hypothetical protein [Cyclobacteriaceae bacterium]
MGEVLSTQIKFFNELKSKIPPNLVLVDVITDELNISNDSAYRRIRGETSLSLEELKHLCSKFGISMDAIFTNSSESVLFSYTAVKPGKFDYQAWFESIEHNLKMLSAYNLKEMIYGAKDLPLFYFFILPKLAAFKLFFWMRNINNFPGMEEMKFDPGAINNDILNKAKNVWAGYISIPSIEIWSEEAITITLRQIEYYHEIGRFKNKSDALELLDDYRSVIRHVQQQAESGTKFRYGNEPGETPGNYQLYLNEVIILDNTAYFKMGDFSMVHLGHNVMNILSTTNPDFCRDTYITLNNLIKNSTLISSASEKERNRFFNYMFKRIDDTLGRINRE